MVFELKGKVALITGGASGIGLRYAKELLRNGVRGVTLADVVPEFGDSALKEIEKEFGGNKAIFIKTDVTNKHEFEDAFKKTVEVFKNIDILINNAGILNDAIWEREIDINLKGTINGVILGLENYLQKYKQGSEALIVNIASIAGIGAYASFPVYGATKAAVISLTRKWGLPAHYNRTKVRIVAICPGITLTPMISEAKGKCLEEPYERILDNNLDDLPPQEPEHVATEMVKVIVSAPSGTLWVIEGGEPAYQFIVPDRRTMREL